jgi:hypothetical protein
MITDYFFGSIDIAGAKKRFFIVTGTYNGIQ